MRSERFARLLIAAVLVASLLWIAGGTLLVPRLISSAHRGEGPALINDLIDDRDSHQDGVLPEAWQSLYREWTPLVLSLLLVGFAAAWLAASRPRVADGQRDESPFTGSRWWVLLLVVLLYFGAGIVPFAAVEGDDLAIAAGALELEKHGSTELAYRYEVQSGSYWLVAAGGSLGLRTLDCFCALTASAFVAFVLLASVFVSRMSLLPVPACGLLLLLFQESSTSAYFANSTMPAAALLFGGLVVATRPGRWVPLTVAILTAAAVWVRFDAVLVIPATALLLWGEAHRRVERLTLFVGGSIVVLAGLLAASGVTPGAILSSYALHTDEYSNLARTLKVYSTTASALMVVLMAVGAWRLGSHRKWRLLLLVSLGVVPSIVGYGISVTTPKYLLYTLPFLAILAAAGLQAVIESGRRAWAIPLLAVLFVGQYLVDPSVMPPRARQIRTDDGIRSRGALLGNPSRWSWRKLTMRRDHQQVDHAIDRLVADNPNPVIIGDGWLPSRIPLYRLLAISDRRPGPLVPADPGKMTEFAVRNRTVTVIVFRPRFEQVLTDSLAERLGLGPGSSFLLIGGADSPDRIAPSHLREQVSFASRPAWILRIP